MKQTIERKRLIDYKAKFNQVSKEISFIKNQKANFEFIPAEIDLMKSILIDYMLAVKDDLNISEIDVKVDIVIGQYKSEKIKMAEMIYKKLNFDLE